MHGERRDPPVSHAVWPDQEPTRRSPWAIVRAICGETIRYMESDPHPTCAECARLWQRWSDRDPEKDIGL